MRRRAEGGLILLPVVITALLLAALVTLMRFEAVGDTQRLQAGRERERIEYVLAAALTDAEARAGRASCSGYSLAETAFGTDSYAASFTPGNGSPVTITATATLANGNTRSAQRSAVAIHQGVTQQLVLQPDAAAGIDVTLDESRNTRNFGADASLEVQEEKRNALLAFDLSALPPGVRIVSAQLELFGAATGNPITAYAVLRDWVEGPCVGANGTGATTALNTKTAQLAAVGSSGTCRSGVGATWKSYDGSAAWASDGGDFGAAVSAPVAVPNGLGWFVWDIGPLVREWVTGTRTNAGLILTGTSSSKTSFASSDDTTASHRPRLVINYRCECGKTC